MAKKLKNIVLAKKRTKVEITGDNWLVDVRYLVNGKESYFCQILRPDLPGRIESLKMEVIKLYQVMNEKYMANPIYPTT
jgi:hypothetical protein